MLVLAVGFGVYLATGSGDDHKTSLETSPSTLTASCKSVANGYAVEYPAAWYVEKADPAWSCALFDPHRFTLEPDTEAPMVAVTIYTERTISFDAAVTGMTDPSSYKVLERRDTTVDGRRAVVLETVQLADQLLPAGTYSYQYVVDRSGGIVLVVTTGEPGSTHDQFRSVLDDMVASLRFGG